MAETKWETLLARNSVGVGVIIFLFGALKFLHPFKGWYESQVALSQLPPGSFAGGILGEIAIGLALVSPFALPPLKRFTLPILTLASLGLVGVMVVAIFVHMHPAVPASVLPLKIKPPVIPGGFLLLGLLNLAAVLRLRPRPRLAAE